MLAATTSQVGGSANTQIHLSCHTQPTPTHELAEVLAEPLLALAELPAAQVVDAEEGDDGVDDQEAEGPVLGDERGEGLQHLHLWWMMGVAGCGW